MNEQVSAALEYLNDWAKSALPSDFEEFYNGIYEVYGINSHHFMFIDRVPIWCASAEQCELARSLNKEASQGNLLMRGYDSFLVRDRHSGAIRTILGSESLEIFSSSPTIKVVPKGSIAACDLHKANKRSHSVCIVKLETFGGRVEDLTIRPNEKMVLVTRDEALYLRTENKEIPIAPLNDVMGNFDRYFMQKDKIEGLVRKANELKNSANPMQRIIGQELLKILKDYGL